MKKLTTLTLATLLYSTSALAGGGHEGATSGNYYNDNATATNNSMTVLGNPTYIYLGAELGWMNADSSGGFTNNDNFWTVAPVVGLRVGQYFGVETSYTWSTSEHDITGSVKMRDYAADALGYLPINDSKTVELVGLVGVGRYKYDTSVPGSDSDTALRYGGGLQYEMGPNWSGRILYRRAEVKTSALDGVDTATLGLTYNFR